MKIQDSREYLRILV